MKTTLLFTALFSFFMASAQITTPVIKAGFGVDADLRANYFNNFVQSGNDDWFSNNPGTGSWIIDTTGAAAIMSKYAVDPNFRKLPFFRTMRVPQFSIVNNRVWIDAVYIRDYNGQAGGDSTAFVMSNKNGDSPQTWDGGVTSVLDKNDISDMFVHVRRAGPSKYDSLWFLGGISLQGTTGNRYFDFELYQTDIFYSRTTGQFTNYGPDEGHTSWILDGAGNIVTPGDVIFSAEYSSSSLTYIEARIWIHKSMMLITPQDFDWGGDFDGASVSSEYGYANILPKNGGTYYTGLQCTNGTWPGPFGFINSGNNLVTTYAARQFMEFSVNLSKLGLDPLSLLGGGACGLPFRRILVKTRSSTSFESELKDFIGPFDFFVAPPVNAIADVPLFCGQIGVSNISVLEPATASVYTWTTPDGHIYGDTTGPNITVDTPGMYIVTQQLLDGCAAYSADTVYVTWDSTCIPMQNNITSFKGGLKNNVAALQWKTKANSQIEYFELERSFDGSHFETITKILPVISNNYEEQYQYDDVLSEFRPASVYYRLKIKRIANTIVYSNILRLNTVLDAEDVLVYPNPATNYLQLAFVSEKRQEARINIFNAAGSLVFTQKTEIKEGNNTLQLDLPPAVRTGAYMINVATDDRNTWKKFVVAFDASGY